MSKKLFCGGLPWEVREEELTQAMSTFGEVTDAKVILDKETGRSRGFGFVTFASESEAKNALSAGSLEMRGRTVRLNPAQERNGRSNGGHHRRPRHAQTEETGPVIQELRSPSKDGQRKRKKPKHNPDDLEERPRRRREKRHKERGGANRNRW